MTRRRHKYNAKATIVHGVRFASQREANRYGELRILEHAGEISDLTLQPKFKLGSDENPVLIRSKGYPNGRRASYIADFRYFEKGKMVVEDVKGMDTPVSRLKRAIVEAQYGIRIVLI